MAGMGPAMQLIVRLPGSVTFLHGPSTSTPGEPIATFEAAQAVPSPDGRYVALVVAAGVQLLNGDSKKQVAMLAAEGTTKVAFSPAGKFVATLQKAAKDGAEKNLKVWALPSGQLSHQLHHRAKPGAPWVEWSDDDSLMWHAVTNTLHAYDATNFDAGIVKKLSIKGVTTYAVSPTGAHVATYVPEAKGSPGYVAIFDYSSAGPEVVVPQAIARKAFYRSSACKLMWNSKGSALLAMAISDVDATNQSYYGEQKLHYLAVAGEEATVPLPKDGPIHDVQWSPSGEQFITVAGFMPAKTTLWTERCKPFYDFGSGPHNLVRWNCHGRFVAVAGFGNLPGDVVFYVRTADGKCKQMGAVRAENGVSLEWSPDGRSLLVATTAPRLRVDNGVRVYKHNGELLMTKAYDMLLDAAFKPEPPGSYEDRPQSPPREGASTQSSAAQQAGYVPPHLRGKPGAAAAAAAAFSLARDPNDRAGKIPSRTAGNLPPGAAPPATKAASKNARRRSGSKKKADGGDGSGAGNGAADVSGGATGVADAMQALTTTNDGDAAAVPAGDGTPAAAGSADAAKRARNLTKKLHQIEALKQRVAAEGRGALDPDQLKKVDSEAALRTELAALQAQL